jgi:hypothetical protein
MMAYLNFAEHGAAASQGFLLPQAAPVRDEATEFDTREWSVVRLAREDRLSSVFPESGFGRVVRRIFGIERQNELSDPKLEALRRIAVLSWHHGFNIASSTLREFFEAGFSHRQYELLLKHIGTARADRVRRAI